MIVVREKIIPSILPNATVNKIYVDGEHTQFEIIPDKGFKLHDARLDTEEFDEETLEFTGNIIKGFKTKGVTVRYDYDFDSNPIEIYAVENEQEEEI